VKLDSLDCRFGGAQKFPVRFTWLTKGVRAVAMDPKAFEKNSATVDLGVGSAMVKSIKYWLQACQLLDKGTGALSPLCSLIFDENTGWDPYLEDDGTIWLLHWMLASNAIDATAIFWFFNLHHQSEFAAEETTTALRDFVNQNIKKSVSPGTLDADVSVLLRMYSQSKVDARTPLEDSLDSPFSGLGLMAKGSGDRRYLSRFSDRPNLPNLILGYAALTVMRSRGTEILPIEDLMYSKDNYAAPGTVFRLTEDALIRKLEELSWQLADFFEVRESNGINQLFRKVDLEPEALVHGYYKQNLEEVAA